MQTAEGTLPSLKAIDAAIARRARRPKSSADLAEQASGGRWRHAAHLALLNQKLLALAEGTIKRLIVTCPPRHGKSQICSRYLPAWYLGTWPDRRVILCSYEAEFAATWGGQARDILEEHGPHLFGVSVREDARARHEWKLADHDGGMVTAGVGGPITGRGANLLILDDPIKNMEEALSRTYREKTWQWWQSTALTRLEPDGSVLVIVTRWHEDDLVGRLLKGDPEEADAANPDDERWEILNLPALAEADDPLGREPGEALWPERYSAERLGRRRRRLGEYVWHALFQQRPGPSGGDLFQRADFCWYRTTDDLYELSRPDADGSQPDRKWAIRRDECSRFATMDVAATEKQTSDWTVVAVWDQTPSYELILVDLWRARVQIPQAVANAVRLCREHDAQFIGVESNGVGIAVKQAMAQKGITVRGLHAKGDKVMRSQAAQLRMRARMIFFPSDAAFMPDVQAELEGFPRSEHDDVTDALSWACYLVQRVGGAPVAYGDAEYKQAKAEQGELLERDLSHPGDAIPKEAVTLGAEDLVARNPELAEWLENGK